MHLYSYVWRIYPFMEPRIAHRLDANVTFITFGTGCCGARTSWQLLDVRKACVRNMFQSLLVQFCESKTLYSVKTFCVSAQCATHMFVQTLRCTPQLCKYLYSLYKGNNRYNSSYWLVPQRFCTSTVQTSRRGIVLQAQSTCTIMNMMCIVKPFENKQHVRSIMVSVPPDLLHGFAISSYLWNNCIVTLIARIIGTQWSVFANRIRTKRNWMWYTRYIRWRWDRDVSAVV